MTTQCQHETIHDGRCMCCCQKVSKPTVRPVFAFASKGKDGKPVVWIDPDYLAEQEDYEATIASLMIGIGRY